MFLRLVAVALIFAAVVGACGLVGEREIPVELQGVWTTSDPRFEGRSLVLKKNAVIFDSGVDRPSINVVTSVSTERQDHHTVYTIRYLTREEREHTLSLSYDPEQRVVELTNRPAVQWTRKEAVVLPTSVTGQSVTA